MIAAKCLFSVTELLLETFWYYRSGENESLHIAGIALGASRAPAQERALRGRREPAAPLVILLGGLSR